MDVDVIIVGGGLAGSTLATVLARKGRKVLILEREKKFKDRVRGENMQPWGVSTARRLGVLEDLYAAGGRVVPFFSTYAMGEQMERRPLSETTPSRESCLNMYHPDLQETLLAGAVTAGAEVKRGAVVRSISKADGGWTVTVAEEGDALSSVTARLVVGADGRSSKVREWGGFTVSRDTEFLRIAGTVVDRTKVPEDAAHFVSGPGTATFIAPLGNERARMYFIYVSASGERKLSGKDKGPAFIEACRGTGAPASWFDGVEVTGPLAEFDCATHWVPSPTRAGLALVGDAAGCTDPSWGCGLSKTLVDVESLSRNLTETDDWDLALKRYAAEHDEYFGKLHNIQLWMTELMWTPGPAADERRAKVFPRMQADPTGYPDVVGQGPFGPCDEQARRLLLGEA